MRFWTAIGAWAGLMAMTIALYALGLSLEAKPHSGSSVLIPIAFGFGALATLIFAGDLAYLFLRYLRRKRAQTEPLPEYGALDYQPEFENAIKQYLDAQQEITGATSQAADVFGKYQPVSSQAEADECGEAASQLCAAYDELLPLMDRNGKIARQCLRGFLRVSPPKDRSEVEALRGLRTNTREARMSTTGYLRSIKNGRKVTRRLRGSNLSRSLNESASLLQAHLKEAMRIVREMLKGLRSAERQMGRRLFWSQVLIRSPMPPGGISSEGEG